MATKLPLFLCALFTLSITASAQTHRHHKRTPAPLITLHVYTVATLPPASSAGNRGIAIVTDAIGVDTTCRTGNGAKIPAIALSDGHSWICH
jgi:hypothetical protein